jgi:predicted ABC-type ATPase
MPARSTVHPNPFSTRFTRPGAIPFVFAEHQSARTLVERLAGLKWCGQIIGPHGSGKSTLVATLAPALEAAGRKVVIVALHQGEHRLPALHREALAPSAQIIIDGFEQLSWWSRRQAKSLCRRHGAGLLVTTHSDSGISTIYETRPTPQLAQALVHHLVRDGGGNVTADDVFAAFAASGGNVRETLFKLYDVYRIREAP